MPVELDNFFSRVKDVLMVKEEFLRRSIVEIASDFGPRERAEAFRRSRAEERRRAMRRPSVRRPRRDARRS